MSDSNDTLSPADREFIDLLELKTREGALKWSAGRNDYSVFLLPMRQFIFLYPPKRNDPPRLTLHNTGGDTALDIQDSELVPLWELVRIDGDADVVTAIQALQSLKPHDEGTPEPPETCARTWERFKRSVYDLLCGPRKRG